MKNCYRFAAAVLLFGLGMVEQSSAGPITAAESQRQTRVLEELNKLLVSETTDADKFSLIARVTKEERSADVRRRILERATRIPGPDLEKYLTNLLTDDEDAGLRSQAAATLGRMGSEKCLTPLADAARNDRPTVIQIGDIGGQSSARRAATFAIVDLVARFPKLADEAAVKLRDLPFGDDVKDNENLADARIQALYQITNDNALLKPFYERLKSKDAKERAAGVIAFRFLKLKSAPTEIINALKDASADVRSWSALVLGEIGDLKTTAALMNVAGNSKEDASVRCNAIYSLGRMKTTLAAELMEQLLWDPSSSVQSNAAVALYRITGKKVKQFPAGYKAD